MLFVSFVLFIIFYFFLQLRLKKKSVKGIIDLSGSGNRATCAFKKRVFFIWMKDTMETKKDPSCCSDFSSYPAQCIQSKHTADIIIIIIIRQVFSFHDFSFGIDKVGAIKRWNNRRRSTLGPLGFL